MNIHELEKIKKKALEDNIPIIMDDTLETIEEYLKDKKSKRILEIGTAVRLFCNLFYKVFRRRWYNRYNRKRYWKSRRS